MKTKAKLNIFLLSAFLSLSPSVLALNSKELSISGISSGAFMASQMAVIYSDQFSALATVAGGTYYCAEDHLNETREKYSYTLGDASLFLFEPTKEFFSGSFDLLGFARPGKIAKWLFPSKANPIYLASSCMSDRFVRPDPKKFALEFERLGIIAPTDNIKKQRILIYQGISDKVVNPKNSDHLVEFYSDMEMPKQNILKIEGSGGHNFPTDKEGLIPCAGEEVPYVASCNLDLAGNILNHFFKRELKKGVFNPKQLFIVTQEGAPESLARYGYAYASNKCLLNSASCHLHVALHGCKMSDSYSENFQKSYETQVQFTGLLKIRDSKSIFKGSPSFLSIQNKKAEMGLLKFARYAGFAEYAEENDLIILFPQTWITEKNYPYNPKGCWDWFGWTGSDYATNKGIETKWLMNYIIKFKKDPASLIQPKLPDFEAVD